MKLSSLSSSSFFSYIIALFFIISLCVFCGKDLVLDIVPLQYDQMNFKNDNPVLPFIINHTTKGCDIFAGKWVYDDTTMPHYEEKECPYIQPQLTCQKQGRLDTAYQHWRWQPHDCSLPRLNASLMMEMIRGKRMLYVGDSLNRGQYTSMICLLHRLIPENAKSLKTIGSLTVFRALEYNATIEFYWAPFLVESNSDNAIVHRVKDRFVRIDSIERHAKHWKGADIIVFNTYVWWMTGRPMNTIRQPFTEDLKDVKMMKTEEVYRLTIKVMLNWVKKNMDPLKTRVFFTSMSPAHESSKEWGGDLDGNCYNQTEPINNPNYWGKFSNKMMMQVVKEEFQRSAIPITLINITQLSEYRKDAHTSIYKKQWNPLTLEQIANPTSYADCIHWCLPGLQDTWNELLYTKLFFS